MSRNIRSKTIRPDLQLGDWVEFDQYLMRSDHMDDVQLEAALPTDQVLEAALAETDLGFLQQPRYKYSRGHMWVTQPCAPTKGILVGYRNKQNGRWDSEEEGWGRHSYWVGDKRVPCALVATDLHSEPEIVPRECLKRVEPPRALGKPPAFAAPYGAAWPHPDPLEPHIKDA